jgi:hypothetical protein
MRLDRPTRRLFSILAGSALMLAACGARPSAGPASPAAAAGAGGQPSAAAPNVTLPAAMLAVGRAGEPGLEVVETGAPRPAMTMPLGVPDRHWVHLLTTVPDGAATIVRNQGFGDSRGPELRLDGHWRLPTMGQDPLPVGRSLDDSTIVLVEDRGAAYDAAGPSRFAILHADAAGALKLVHVLALRGAFEFDALSPDGSILYLVEHLDAGNGGRYQVRSIASTASKLDDTPITDKRFIDEPMAGVPITQLRRSDGIVMTLYRGPEHPFVHALNSTERWALCIDLPANGADDADAAADWGLAETADGSTVYAVNATLGLVVDISPYDLSVRRSARLPASTAAGPAIVLAKFGHEDSGAVGRRAVVTPDGSMIIAGGRDGIVAVSSRDLSIAWRALPGAAVRALALTRDGSSLFALLGTGRIAALSAADGASRGTLPGEGYDRLIATSGG